MTVGSKIGRFRFRILRNGARRLWLTLFSRLSRIPVFVLISCDLPDPGTIYPFPVKLVCVFSKERHQRAVFDTSIATELQPFALNPLSHRRRPNMKSAAQLPLAVVFLVSRSQTFFPDLAPHRVLGAIQLARDYRDRNMPNR